MTFKREEREKRRERERESSLVAISVTT
jgi:hypothetical protein